MQIQNAIITGSFSYNGADLSNVTSSNAYSASLSSRTTDLESTSSVLVGASSSFSSILTSVSSSQQQLSSSFLTLTASFNAVSASQQQISASYIALSASYNTFSGSASTRVSQIENVYATTGSNSFRATQSITGSLTVTGQIVAQSINIQQVTSSIIYSSGSNVFGCDLNSRQTFTGSVNITGSQTVFGNVGIGTSNPANKLQICTTGTAENVISITNGTQNLQLGLNTSACGSYLFEQSNSALRFGTADTERMRITNCGNVGIGTCVPSDRLSITDASTYTFNIGAAAGGAGAVLYTLGSAALTFATCGSSNERMRITSIGQVAIGATSNLNNFTIKSSSDTITAGGLSFQSRTCVTNYIAMGLNSSNDFEIQTWTTPSWLTRMYIKNDGNIGIGKTPEAISTFRTLDIQGSTGAGVRLSDATNSTNLQQTTGDFYINNISSGTIYFYNGNVERVRITSSGLVIKSYQTYFNARSSTSQCISTGDTKVIYDTIVCSVGGNFNTASSRFTAPVSGIYAFTLSSSVTSGGIHTYHALYIKINGTTSENVNYRFRGAANSCTGQWFGIIGAAQIPLAANDYVEIFGYTDATTMTLQAQETRWQGYLVG